MINDFPIIRLEVEGMKYQVLHAFNEHQANISEAVKKSLDLAVSNFKFDEHIAKVARDYLDKEIRHMVESAIYELMHDKEIKDKIKDLIKRELRWPDYNSTT